MGSQRGWDQSDWDVARWDIYTNTLFDEAVKRLEAAVATPKIVYLDGEPDDCIVDGDVVYRVDIFTDDGENAIKRVEKVT